MTLVRSTVYLRYLVFFPFSEFCRTPERRTQESWANSGWRKDRPEFQQKKKRRRRKPKTNVPEGETQIMAIEQVQDDTELDFDSLPTLNRPLQVGDLFAYKIFEVGPDWVMLSD